MKEMQFNRMWEKNGKMKCKIKSWVQQRGINPTEDNCRDYWCGLYKPYNINRWAGVKHLHEVKDGKQIRRLTQHGKQRQNNGKHTHKMGRYNKRKERGTYGRK